MPSFLPELLGLVGSALCHRRCVTSRLINRSRDAANAIRSASDLTYELLKANTLNLKQGNAEARREIERGVFDIEAVKQANASLIETIEESLSIADEGRRKRAEAAIQLETLESELRRTLVSATARVNTRAGQQ